jgi:hypothetical protein
VREVLEVVAAAWQGRVQFLFVAVDAQCWGRLDRETGHVAVHETPDPGDEELLDLTAVGTFLRGGTVYAGPAAGVPGGGPLAAILRY